jgi:hypothetical protein
MTTVFAFNSLTLHGSTTDYRSSEKEGGKSGQYRAAHPVISRGFVQEWADTESAAENNRLNSIGVRVKM